MDKFKEFFPHLDIIKDWESQDQGDKEQWRNPDNIYVLLLDELLMAAYGIEARILKAVESIDPAELEDNPIKILRRRLSRMLYVGRHTFIHDFIIGGLGRGGYGKLIGTDNPVARISCQREVSFYGPCGGIHSESTGEYYLRDVHGNDLNRICPVEAAQGHTVGLRLGLARRAGIDFDTRRITAPDDPEPGDSLGHAASLIPFVEHNDVNRALMGANMLKQAIPLREPDTPWVQTGHEQNLIGQMETRSLYSNNHSLVFGKNLFVAYLPWGLETFEDGIVISESASQALTSRQQKTFWFEQRLPAWRRNDGWTTEVTADNSDLDEEQKSSLDDHGIIRIGTQVKLGDVLVSAIQKKYTDVNKTQTLDFYTSVALGIEHGKIEDCSLFLEKFRGTIIEIIDSEESKGIPLPKGVKRRIGIKVESCRPAKVGDKIAGRHGNKGVIVKIYPDAEMPYSKANEPYCNDAECQVGEPHRHAEVLLNPLGVIGRLNLGQLFETTLGKVAEATRKPITVKSFQNNWNVDSVGSELKANGFSTDGKEQLYIHHDRAEKALQFESLAGPQYFIRLPHIAEDKIMGRASASQIGYSMRDNQPHRGKRFIHGQMVEGGQRVGEMETWALAGHGAWSILDDFFNFKSDDLLRRQGKQASALTESARRPQAFVNLIFLFRAVGLDLLLIDENGIDVTALHLRSLRGADFNKAVLSLAGPDKIAQWDLAEELSLSDLEAVQTSLSAKVKRVLIKPWQMQYIDFPAPVVNPLFAETAWEIFNYPDTLTEHKKKTKNESGAWSTWAVDLAEVLTEAEDWPELVEPEDKDLKRHFRKVEKGRKQFKQAGIKPTDLLLSRLPVAPRSFYAGQLRYRGELVQRYRNVLYFKGRLSKSLEDYAPGDTTVRDEMQKLYWSVEKLFGLKRQAGLLNIIQGKTGLIRGRLAGKRMDFSGRAVIVGGPDLELDQVGLPNRLWDKLLPGVAKDTNPLVLLNRQPSLHRNSFQAFRAVHHEQGDVIRLNPFVCSPFNADFDGDTMALHVPRTPWAVNEAERLLPSLNLFSQANGGLTLGFDRDIALAASFISFHPTMNNDDEVPYTEDNSALESSQPWWTEKEVNGVNTTIGRIELRKILGPDVPLFNWTLEKGEWNRLVSQAAKHMQEKFAEFTTGISSLFGRALMFSGLSASLDDFDKFRTKDYQPNKNPNFLFLASKAGRYSSDLETQITSARGFMRRPQEVAADPVEVKSCLLAGHNENDYLLSAHGARSGLVDRGLNTSYSGHLMRDMILKVQHLRIVQEDCGANEGIPIEGLYQPSIQGMRFEVNGDLITNDESVELRSPLTCMAQDPNGRTGICQKCYGLDPATGKLPELGLPVGVLAAQAVAERVSQLTMRTFHTGGAQTLDGDDEEKFGLALVKVLREQLGKKRKNLRPNLEVLLRQFPKSGRPTVIHFEVLLRGYSGVDDVPMLAALFKSQAVSNIRKLTWGRAEDDISTVLSRLAAGHLTEPPPVKLQGEKNGH